MTAVVILADGQRVEREGMPETLLSTYAVVDDMRRRGPNRPPVDYPVAYALRDGIPTLRPDWRAAKPLPWPAAGAALRETAPRHLWGRL